MESPKFCKDCKYFVPIGAKCQVFKNLPAIVVRPDPKRCGESAKFFKPKNTPYSELALRDYEC